MHDGQFMSPERLVHPIFSPCREFCLEQDEMRIHLLEHFPLQRIGRDLYERVLPRLPPQKNVGEKPYVFSFALNDEGVSMCLRPLEGVSEGSRVRP